MDVSKESAVFSFQKQKKKTADNQNWFSPIPTVCRFPPNSSSAPLNSGAPDETKGRPPLRRSWIGAHHANFWVGKKRSYKVFLHFDREVLPPS